MWNHESSRRAYSHHESYLTHLNGDAINSLFPLWPQLHGSYRNANLTDALKALAGHDHDNSGHNALSCLSAEPPCQSPSGCAPFLQPLALHANHTFPQKHAQLYVSWIVWLAWQLWELLESLLDALNNIDCTAHGCATCLCQPSNHNDKDSCHCPSLVECGGPLPTLYRYGFTYRNAHALLAGSQKIRCSDLNDQLTKALHSDHFTQLFHQIDQLLYTIRMPFLFAITALWLIATLFIAHSLLYHGRAAHPLPTYYQGLTPHLRQGFTRRQPQDALALQGRRLLDDDFTRECNYLSYIHIAFLSLCCHVSSRLSS
ncbi:Extracellular matrix-binding ebh [Babesia ovata]|uniref:Extracellular matrix-binding ebh n=1 Tax=Babesia ovata TaxID=189622 RepID=A0A2H6KJ19_9APIC|nr:Extracellular matrix-binding ebh [Babesia ovata]GBE62984.1 Extracellular matrix-binding ebh [Babesia ovata]